MNNVSKSSTSLAHITKYRASKTMAEKGILVGQSFCLTFTIAAWKFVKNNKDQIALDVVINPPLVSFRSSL